MKGELVLTDLIEDELFEYELNPSFHDFSLSIYVDENNPLEKQLTKKEKFMECIKYMKSIGDDEISFYDSEEKEIEFIYNNLSNILDSVEYIKLCFLETKVKEYISKNPKLLTKKIVLNETLEITDYDKLMQIMNEYKDIVDKVYVSMVDNSNYVSLKTCYRTISVIIEQADEIKKLNLSPMETIMYVYDQVRNRVYTHEEKDESLYKSRDLSEVMFGDKIVCAGYANIFHALLSYLGIKSSVVRLIDKNDKTRRTGHARNIVYVQDSKYDIDGIYYFDPTWDSKRKNENNEFLYHYNNFAKTRREVDSDKIHNYEDTYFTTYYSNIYERVEKKVKNGDFEGLMQYFKTINHMSCLINGEILIRVLDIVHNSPTYGCFDKELFLKKFKDVSDKFKKELSAETLIKLLNNVRKIEYYKDPEFYPYSIDDIYKTYMLSNWEFSSDFIDSGTQLLLTIFGKEIDFELDPTEKFIKYGNETKLFEDINKVRLTKTLQRTLSKKIQ